MNTRRGESATPGRSNGEVDIDVVNNLLLAGGDGPEPIDKPQKQATDPARQPVTYRRISCAELDASTYDLEYLIDDTLVAGQPCIVAGGKKCLKTSLLIDLGISLAVGGLFLGKLRVNRACRVGIMTGESGLATIQETARRICYGSRAQSGRHRRACVFRRLATVRKFRPRRRPTPFHHG